MNYVAIIFLALATQVKGRLKNISDSKNKIENNFILFCYPLIFQCLIYLFLTGDCNGGMFSELTNCCNATHPCNIGQGDCDSDEDCLGNLVCGRQNCGPGFF